MTEQEESYWNGKRVLVTGATGLVGSWLSKALIEKGAHVVALIRDSDPQSELFRSGAIQSMHVVQGCLEDFASIERAVNEQEPDTVFHLAAQAIVGVANRNPLATFESNIRGTYHLLEACRIHRSLVKRIVIASSDKAYGTSTQLPYKEEMPPMGRHPYDVSKSCADLISQSYFHTYRLPLVIARCGNIYGGGDLNWSRLIPSTIRALHKDQPPLIRSNGRFTRDYVFVEDAVDAYLTMAEALNRPEIRGEAFNFGPEKPLTVLEIVHAIQKLMGKEHILPVILNQSEHEIPDQYLSSEKALRLLKWRPHFSLEEGLAQTIAWYKAFLEEKRSSFSTFKAC